MEAYMQPTELMNLTDTPQYKEFWQFIAYGAAKKIFEDRSDENSIREIMPEFINQEILINRRTIVQQSSERAQTIYANQPGVSTGWPGYGIGWPNS